MPEYRALAFFRRLFDGRRYLHRSSTHGDKLAIEFFEDLYDLGRSKSYINFVDSHVKGVSPKNTRVGIRSRRADGLFGDLIPQRAKVFPSYHVARGPIATINIGVETKILHKSQKKQISDRIQGLEKQADYMVSGTDRRKRDNPISVAIIGLNYSDYTIGYEGDRAYQTDGTSAQPHPADEAPSVEAGIQAELGPVYSHIILLRYLARNDPPFAFSWKSAQATEDEYAATLIRVSNEFDRMR
jgi:hypothetical protein